MFLDRLKKVEASDVDSISCCFPRNVEVVSPLPTLDSVHSENSFSHYQNFNHPEKPLFWRNCCWWAWSAEGRGVCRRFRESSLVGKTETLSDPQAEMVFLQGGRGCVLESRDGSWPMTWTLSPSQSLARGKGSPLFSISHTHFYCSHLSTPLNYPSKKSMKN